MRQGHGLLAIWNDIKPGGEDDFRAWHSGEHLGERLSVPGFLLGRRLFSEPAVPRWLTLYLTQTPAILSSPAYVARLNAPSDWTLRTLPLFTGTERLASQVLWAAGEGRGRAVLTVRAAQPMLAELQAAAQSAVTQGQALAAAIVQALPEAPQNTRERSLRSDERTPPAIAAFLELDTADTADALKQSFPAAARIDCYTIEDEVAPQPA